MRGKDQWTGQIWRQKVWCPPVSVDVAQEEHMVPSTVPASGVLRVARLAEVIPMFDGSADGSEHEVPEGTARSPKQG